MLTAHASGLDGLLPSARGANQFARHSHGIDAVNVRRIRQMFGCGYEESRSKAQVLAVLPSMRLSWKQNYRRPKLRQQGKSGSEILRILIAIRLLIACLAVIAIAAVALIGAPVESDEKAETAATAGSAHEYENFADGDVDPAGRADFEKSLAENRSQVIREFSDAWVSRLLRPSALSRTSTSGPSPSLALASESQMSS